MGFIQIKLQTKNKSPEGMHLRDFILMQYASYFTLQVSLHRPGCKPGLQEHPVHGDR